MQWLRFGGQAGATGFATDATWEKPAKSAAPVADAAPKEKKETKASQAAKGACFLPFYAVFVLKMVDLQGVVKKKQEKKPKKVWTEADKAAAQAKKAAGGGEMDNKQKAKAEREAKKAAAKAGGGNAGGGNAGEAKKDTGKTAKAKAKEPEPEEEEEVAPAVVGGPSGAETVAKVAGYYYAGFGVWALRSGESPSTPTSLPAPRAAVPLGPLRDGRGGPKAEAAPGANEYVAVETQGASGGGGSAAAPKQQQPKKEKKETMEKKKEAVGEAVVEVSDADMVNSMRSGADAAAEAASSRSARVEKLSDSGVVESQVAKIEARESTPEKLSAAAAGLFAAAGGAKPAGDDWEMVEKGDANSQLQKFMDTCHTIISGFIKGRGHKVPEVRALHRKLDPLCTVS